MSLKRFLFLDIDKNVASTNGDFFQNEPFNTDEVFKTWIWPQISPVAKKVQQAYKLQVSKSSVGHLQGNFR